MNEIGLQMNEIDAPGLKVDNPHLFAKSTDLPPIRPIYLSQGLRYETASPSQHQKSSGIRVDSLGFSKMRLVTIL